MDHLTTICRTIRALHTLHRVAVITDNVATITEELSEQLACIGTCDSNNEKTSRVVTSWSLPMLHILGTPEDVITSEDALVLQLVQQIAMPSTPLDVSLAAALAAPLAHLGPQAASLSPPALLALQPASTVNASFSAVLHILHGALSPSTCFTLLGAAYHLDAPCLFRAAHTLCVANFTTAQQLDAQGLATLPLPVLKVLLRDQGLRVWLDCYCFVLVLFLSCQCLPFDNNTICVQQVDSELQVFQAAASWVTASPAHRLPILRPLLGMCVCVCVSSSSIKNPCATQSSVSALVTCQSSSWPSLTRTPLWPRFQNAPASWPMPTCHGTWGLWRGLGVAHWRRATQNQSC